jgi:hypothetical protein
MDYLPTNQYEEAGTTIYLSLLSYLSLSVRLDGEGRRKVVLRYPLDQMETQFNVRSASSSLSLPHVAQNKTLNQITG